MGKKIKTKSAAPIPQPLAAEEDADLMNDLLAELDSRNSTVQTESAKVLNAMQLNKVAEQADQTKRQDARSRFQARQARKAASAAQHYAPDDPLEDERLRKEADEEESDIKQVCDELGVTIHQITPDGHCLFSAIADQLEQLSILPSSQANFATVRLAASNYIWTHPDDFLPFLPSSSGEDGTGATDAGLMSPAQFEQYCAAIRDTGIWGGEPEILALSRAYNVPIHVVQGGTPPIVVHNPSGEPKQGDIQHLKVVRLSYHRRLYGLGEHYNSLRPKSAFSRLIDPIQAIVS